jgi:hypothetical protein
MYLGHRARGAFAVSRWVWILDCKSATTHHDAYKDFANAFPKVHVIRGSGLSRRATLLRLGAWPQASILPCTWSKDILGGKWWKPPPTTWSIRAKGGRIQARTRSMRRLLKRAACFLGMPSHCRAAGCPNQQCHRVVQLPRLLRELLPLKLLPLLRSTQ